MLGTGLCVKCTEVLRVEVEDGKLISSMSLREVLEEAESFSTTVGNVTLEDTAADVTIYCKASSITLKSKDFGSLVDIIMAKLRRGEIYE
jgi:hypothetical protein